MAYPSVVTGFSTKVNGQIIDASDVNNVQTDVVAIETFVGTLSSIQGTLMYDVRAAASNGGGHVQSVNKGGTGQTSYTVGDLLVATSSSVLTKLAIGSNNQVLTVDNTQSPAVKWAGVATAVNIQNQTYTYAVGSVISASVYAAEISPAPSALTAGQAFAIKFPTSNTASVLAITISSLIAVRIKNPDLSNPVVGGIQASMIGIVEYDGTQFQLETSVPASAKNFTATRVGSTGSGSVILAHGLTKVPTVVEVFATHSPGGANTISFSNGSFNGTTTSCSYGGMDGVGIVGGVDTSNIINLGNAGGSPGNVASVVGLDATNVTLQFTKTGSPNAANINMAFKVQA